jgi:hypothetical protein
MQQLLTENSLDDYVDEIEFLQHILGPSAWKDAVGNLSAMIGIGLPIRPSP